MIQIETNKWKPFLFRDIFDIVKGTRLTKADMIEGEINYIGATAFNNGITAKIGNKEHLHPAGTITVCYNGSIGQAFYQSEPYWATDDVNVLYPKFKITPYIALFLTSIILQIGKRFAYIDKWTAEKMLLSPLTLPVSDSNVPDWDYMEQYMQQLEAKVKNDVSLLARKNKTHQNNINTTTWKRFHLYDDCLFTIDSGTKLDKIKMTTKNPTINFVGRANANNGVTDFIDEIDGLKPYEAGCLTISLGGEYLGSCFIQDKPFYTSQNVNVLIPKHPMSDYCKRFISTMIFREGRLKYKAFIDELNRHVKTDFSILLPVTTDNTPDWDYMEKYMKMMEHKAQTTLNSLNRQRTISNVLNEITN